MISLRGVLQRKPASSSRDSEGADSVTTCTAWQWTGSWSFGAVLDETKALPFAYEWASEIPSRKASISAQQQQQNESSSCTTSEPTTDEAASSDAKPKEVSSAATNSTSIKNNNCNTSGSVKKAEVTQTTANASANVVDEAKRGPVTHTNHGAEITGAASAKSADSANVVNPSNPSASSEDIEMKNVDRDTDHESEKPTISNPLVAERKRSSSAKVKESPKTIESNPLSVQVAAAPSSETFKDAKDNETASGEDAKVQTERSLLTREAVAKHEDETTQTKPENKGDQSLTDKKTTNENSKHVTLVETPKTIEMRGGTKLQAATRKRAYSENEASTTISDGGVSSSDVKDGDDDDEWKLDDHFTDAAEKHDVPKMGQWKGNFKTLGPRKNTFSQISEKMELYLNATPPPDAYIQFPDESEGGPDAPKLPKNYIYARGRGENQYGSFELLGSLDLSTMTLIVQRMYVKTTPSPSTPCTPRATRKRRSSFGSESSRQARKRQMSWKRRAALDTEEETAKRVRRPRESGAAGLSINIPKKAPAASPAPAPSTSTEQRPPSKKRSAQPRATSSANTTTFPTSTSVLKLPLVGEPSLARWRAAHFLYYQRQEAQPAAENSNGAAPAGPTVTPPKYVIYEGEMRDSQRDGRGVCLFHDMIYEGDWKDDKEHGKGILFSSDRKRTIYDGEWERGRMHGQGTYNYSNTSSYHGEWKENLRHGTGTYKLPDGSVFLGQWQNGFQNGRGVMTWPCGSVYDGEWKDGKRHGQGLLRASDGFVYDGNWVLNAMDGRGSATYPNGQEYHGLFCNGRREGRGTIVFTNKAVYEGRFRDDAIDGQGTMKMTKSTVVPQPDDKDGKDDFMIPISFQSDITHIHRKAGFTLGGN